MIVELASLPPLVQAYIKNEQQVQMIIKDGQVHLEPLSPKPKKRVAGRLAHLASINPRMDDDVWFEPMSDEELAWWHGEHTDEYGIGK